MNAFELTACSWTNCLSSWTLEAGSGGKATPLEAMEGSEGASLFEAMEGSVGNSLDRNSDDMIKFELIG